MRLVLRHYNNPVTNFGSPSDDAWYLRDSGVVVALRFTPFSQERFI